MLFEPGQTSTAGAVDEGRTTHLGGPRSVAIVGFKAGK